MGRQCLRGTERQENVKKGKKQSGKSKRNNSEQVDLLGKKHAKERRVAYFRERSRQIKEDPELYHMARQKEHERWKKRVKFGKVKEIENMIGREQSGTRGRKVQPNIIQRKGKSQLMLNSH